MNPKLRETLASVGLLILRIGFGAYMMAHGYGKLQMVLAGQFDQFGDPIGLGSGLSLVLIMFAEFFCALFVLVGFATRFSAIPIVIGMAVAAFVAHGADPWTMGGGGGSKQPALMFMTAFLTLVFTGAGRFSIDHLIAPKVPPAVGQFLK